MQAWHTGIWGDSGGGKTTLLREMHAEFRGVSIVVNHEHEAGFAGPRAASPDKARQVIADAARWDRARVNYWSQRDPKEQIAEVRRLCHAIWAYAGVPQQIVVDEAFELVPDYKADSGPGSGNPIVTALKKDRDKGTKVVLAAQDPQPLYYPAIKQLKYHVWVGTPSIHHRGFMDYMGFPRQQMMELRDYQYMVLNKQAEILEIGQTKKRYSA